MDKTGLVLVLALVSIVVLGAVLMGSAQPVEISVLQAQAGIAAAPAVASPLGGLLKFALWLLVGAVLLSAIGLTIWFVVTRSGSRTGGWKSGPNANWQRFSPAPRKMSLTDLLTLQLTRQIIGDQAPRSATLPDDRQRAEF